MSHEIPAGTISRFERKYRCNSVQYYGLKNALYPYIQKDSYTLRSPKHKYLVRSLYFDTDDYQLFSEKMNGNSNRIKFRIRTYGNSHQMNPDIRVEMKIRNANQSMKYSTFISFAEYLGFMDTKHWKNLNDPILHEFERHTKLFLLKPKTLVEYSREGYFSRDGSNVRLTFDHAIQSANANHLFPELISWHPHFEQGIIFEIKHQSQIPYWLNKVIKNYGLHLVANSKFALGAQLSQPDIVSRAWSDW